MQYDWINGTELIIYCMKGKKPINKRKGNVIQINRLKTEKMIHPTQKPESLINEILEVSANKHDLFCDPFMGSGTTGEAWINLKRRFIGIEKNTEYFDIAKERVRICQKKKKMK